MPRIYEIQLVATAVTAANQQLCEINGGSTKSFALIGVELAQTTELGDAADEQLLIDLITGFTTSGSGGNTPTALPVDLGDAAFSGSCETFNTTGASGGTTATRKLFDWKVLQPGIWKPVPEERIWMPGGTRAVIAINGTPADSITISGIVRILEVG